jgi:hypothetical protein
VVVGCHADIIGCCSACQCSLQVLFGYIGARQVRFGRLQLMTHCCLLMWSCVATHTRNMLWHTTLSFRRWEHRVKGVGGWSVFNCQLSSSQTTDCTGAITLSAATPACTVGYRLCTSSQNHSY